MGCCGRRPGMPEPQDGFRRKRKYSEGQPSVAPQQQQMPGLASSPTPQQQQHTVSTTLALTLHSSYVTCYHVCHVPCHSHHVSCNNTALFPPTSLGFVLLPLNKCRVLLSKSNMYSERIFMRCITNCLSYPVP